MTQTVNDVTDLMSDNTRRPKLSVQMPAMLKYFFTTLALQQVMNQQRVSSFFTSDLQVLRDIAIGLAWVDQVSVTRDWQRGIVVTALSKQPVANFGTERLVDAKGVVFVPADNRELTQENFATLQGEITQAPVIMQQMQRHE